MRLILVSAAEDRLLPPIKVEDVFKKTKGRVTKIRFKDQKGIVNGAEPRDFKPAKTLSGIEKASGLARGVSESVVKFDKASKGIKTSGHLQSACDYISRHGKIDLIDHNGDLLPKDAANERMQQWIDDQEIPASTEDIKRPADARRCIVSCPPGTDPTKLKDAALILGKEIFTEQGYEFVMAVHYRDADHPKEPAHPHAHFLIKAVNNEGKRLNLRKEDLRYIRERFAVIAREHGIELNATSRAVRGKTVKAKPLEQIHYEQKKQNQAQKWAIDRKKKELLAKEQSGGRHRYDEYRRAQLHEALKSGSDLPEHPALKKAKATRVKVEQNMDAYINELRAKGDEQSKHLADGLEKKKKSMRPVESAQQIKLRIAQRKVKERLEQQLKEQGAQGQALASMPRKQSQAQKWAINRKKEQLKNIER